MSGVGLVAIDWAIVLVNAKDISIYTTYHGDNQGGHTSLDPPSPLLTAATAARPGSIGAGLGAGDAVTGYQI